MIRTWHILGLLLAFTLAGGGCLGGDGDEGGGGGGGGTGGSGGTGGNGGGEKTCGQIVDCIVACGQDNTCANACVQQGNDISANLLLAYNDCLVNCQGDQTCAQQTCGGLAATCEADTGKPGLLTCAPLSNCVVGCSGTNAQACANACVAASDEASAQLLQEVFDCRDANCQDAPDVDACVRTTCANEVTACEADR